MVGPLFLFVVPAGALSLHHLLLPGEHRAYVRLGPPHHERIFVFAETLGTLGTTGTTHGTSIEKGTRLVSLKNKREHNALHDPRREIEPDAQTTTTRLVPDATARQVWPASRAAARFVADVISRQSNDYTICELACGLAAPSLAASKRGADAVATDVDTKALDAAKRAAKAQGLPLRTAYFDLRALDTSLPRADAYVFADAAADTSLTAAVSRRVREALETYGALVVVAVQRDRAQGDDLWRRLAEILPSNVAVSTPSWKKQKDDDCVIEDAVRGEWCDEKSAETSRTGPHLVWLEVDEDDPALYS